MLYGYRRWDCLPWLSEIPAAAVSNCLRDSAVRLMLKNPRYPFVGGQGTGCNYSLAEPSRPLSAVKQWLLAYELRRSIARKLGGKKTLISFSLSLSFSREEAGEVYCFRTGRERRRRYADNGRLGDRSAGAVDLESENNVCTIDTHEQVAVS